MQIKIPPLRERKSDIPLLVASFLDKFSWVIQSCARITANRHPLRRGRTRMAVLAMYCGTSLNNPLTGILGNAELLLVDVKRKNLELPASAVRRLEIIVALAVRMRETVRRLSDEWSACEDEALRELQSHPS